VIDAFPESAWRYRDRCPVVCIDVISSTTTAVTLAAEGRRVLPAATAFDLQRLLHAVPEALAAVECVPGETTPPSSLALDPVVLAARVDRRPLVLYDGAGTRLIANCDRGIAVYVACLRNVAATVDFIASRHDEVALLAAGDGGDFRCEDRIAAARIGAGLLKLGFIPEGQGTADTISRWGAVDTRMIGWGRSAQHLRRDGRRDTLEFVMMRVDDLNVVCRYAHGEITAVLSEIVGGDLGAEETPDQKAAI